MILSFPSLDALALAISGGSIRAEVAVGPCSASFDSSGAVSVEASFRLLKAQKGELAAKGIVESKRHVGDEEEFSCWLQLFPVVSMSGPPQLSQQAPVLFDLPDAATMSEFVTEMLRLGNDRQSFRRVAGTDGKARVLLRVIGPPYYTLLRAIEKFAEGPSDIAAFVERAPRVWVELGYSHPFATKVKLTDGQMLFISSPRRWSFASDAPFRDVYEILDFPLPHAPVAYADAGPSEAISIPLRLAAGNAADVAEFWVLPETGFESLDTLVRNADERLIRRLRFAVAVGPEGQTQFALSVAPSKQASPGLSLPGLVGYKPYWKLPNLFVPVGQRLHPPLRRETVRRLLADDPDRAIWLSPEVGGRFVPFAISLDAFRPLDEWVNYIVERSREPIAAWIAATTFDFDSFVCNENVPRLGSGKGDVKASKVNEIVVDKPEKRVHAKGKAPQAKKVEPFSLVEPKIEVRTPSEWELRRGELESQFLGDGAGPLDSAKRLAMWPDLADCHAALGDKDDAAGCYANAIWANPKQSDSIADRWTSCELGDKPLTPERFDTLLKTDPTVAEARTVAAATVAASRQPWFQTCIPAVQQYLAKHDGRMPVRAGWLAATAIARQSGADVLGLARTRDRILGKLFERGLNPEHDLPTFLRYAGLKDSERARVVREKALRLHAAVRTWVVEGLATLPQPNLGDATHTPLFVDLAFAFAFARLQDSETSRELVRKAESALAASRDPADEFRTMMVPLIVSAYRYRIDQALAGKRHAGPLPDGLLQSMKSLQSAMATPHNSPTPRGGVLNPAQVTYYGLVRFFEDSRIAEPTDEREHYDWMIGTVGPVAAELRQLSFVTEPKELARRISRLLESPPADRFAALHKVVNLVPRIGTEFTRTTLEKIPTVLLEYESHRTKGANPTQTVSHEDTTTRIAQLFARAVRVADYFDLVDLIPNLCDLYSATFFRDRSERTPHAVIASLEPIAAVLRNRNRGGELDTLVSEATKAIVGNDRIDIAFHAAKKKSALAAATVLRSYLCLANAKLLAGQKASGEAMIDEVESLIPQIISLPPIEIARVVGQLIGSYGHLDREIGLPKIEALLERIPSSKLVTQQVMNRYYSRLHINIAERVVAAIAIDSFADSVNLGRRWRDEDEYLVRKRIHEDVRNFS